MLCILTSVHGKMENGKTEDGGRENNSKVTGDNALIRSSKWARVLPLFCYQFSVYFAGHA